MVFRIGGKAKKSYPPGTVLIVNCETDSVVLEDEWNEAIKQVKSTGIHEAFREVFLTGLHYSTTFWGGHKRKGGHGARAGRSGLPQSPSAYKRSFSRRC
jgi:hypothetical protein